MEGEQRDYAIAFCKGVRNGQQSGKNNRKLIEMTVLVELLGLSNPKAQTPHNILSVFKEYNVYVRKLRGKDKWAVWWLEFGDIAHGRGVSRR